jgi:hypothetical protein
MFNRSRRVIVTLPIDVAATRLQHFVMRLWGSDMGIERNDGMEMCDHKDATHLVTLGGTVKEIESKASGNRWFSSTTKDGAEYGMMNVRKYLKPKESK